MQTTLFNPKMHTQQVKDWLTARNLATDYYLPETGLIVEGVAVGFLRRCEGGLALIDGYLTNPEAPSEARNEALDAITKGLIKVAGVTNVTQILATTTEPSIAHRALRHGFRIPMQVTLVYDPTTQETTKG